jgi:hypothetical protein
MTIFRSKAADAIGYALALIGIVGFFVCWGIGWNTQSEVLGRTELRQPSAERPAPIEMKGVTWYVDRASADRFKLADSLIIVFWTSGVAGGLVKERARIRAWWISRKVGK